MTSRTSREVLVGDGRNRESERKDWKDGWTGWVGGVGGFLDPMSIWRLTKRKGLL